MNIQELEKRPACEFERDEIVVRLRDLPQQQDAKNDPPDSPRMVAVYYPEGVPKTLEGRGCYIGYFFNGYWHDECGQPCEPDPVMWSEIPHW